MGLDGLASSAYGPEAALAILIPAGALGVAHIGTVMTPIVLLLAILYISYRQTIRAYPTNGGAYTVAKENLGTGASLLAASALMIDYVLNAAVGISAGVAALVSAVPALHPYILVLCLGILILITLVNLRGTLDAGRLFALPTYTFVLCFGVLLAVGLWKAAVSGGSPIPVVPPPPVGAATEAVTLWLLLRAFASGCTAMTGVEAVSNGVSAFREPQVVYGHRTLTAIVGILGALLVGISVLVHAYGIGAMDQTQDGYQSVLSQLAGAVTGRGWFYYIALGSLLCVLALSANTSFTDFPRLCRMVAQDGFLPRPFAVVGRRLVFSVGILYLATTAGLLLIVFGGITDRLIPLFAIGAFMTFTLSQTGMVLHWWRQSRAGGGHRWRMAINGLGATCTAIALVVIIVAKFAEGAWITLLVVPLVIVLLRTIRRYYDQLDSQLREDGPLQLHHPSPPIVLVATEGWNRLTDMALEFALTISPDVIAVHLAATQAPDARADEGALRQRWACDVEGPARMQGLNPPALVIFEAEYRRLDAPLLRVVRQLQAKHPDRFIAVLLPQVIKQSWWQHVLHTHRSRRIRSALLQCAGPRLVVMEVPWRLERPMIPPDMTDELGTTEDEPPVAPAPTDATVTGVRNTEVAETR